MKKSKIINDFFTVSAGILKSIESAKDYSKSKLKSKISRALDDMNFVKREEYEEIRAMYIKSRNEIELLKKNIKNIEKKLIKK